MARRTNGKPRCLVRTTAFLICCFFAFLLFQGCGTTLKYEVVETPDYVATSKVSYESPDKTLSWKGAKVSISGKVYDADFDNNRHAVLFNFSKDKKAKTKQILLYDIETDNILWSAQTNATNFLTGNGAALVEGYKKRHVLSHSDGSFIREGEPGLYLMDGETIVLNKDMIARIDLLSGDIIWQWQGLSTNRTTMDFIRPDYGVGNGYREEYRHGDWLYIVYDWMYAFDVESGDGWNYKVSTSHKGHAEALAKEAAFACLAAFAGTHQTTAVQAKLYHNQNSAPLVEEERTYIAARSNIYCFERTTGDVVWEAKLPREYGGLGLLRAGQYLAVIGKGWKYIDYAIKKDQKPSILLVDPYSGEQMGYLEFDEESVVQDFKWLEDRVLLLTPTRLYSLSHDLLITEVREVTETEGAFLRFMRFGDDEIVIRTSLGLIAVDPEDMSTVWYKILGDAPKYNASATLSGHWKEGARWVLDHGRENNRNHSSHGLEWLSISSGGIVGVDLDNQGEIVMEIDLGTEDFQFDREGVIGKGDGFLIVLPYDNIVQIGD